MAKGWSVAGNHLRACGNTSCEELIKEFTTPKETDNQFSGLNRSGTMNGPGIARQSFQKISEPDSGSRNRNMVFIEPRENPMIRNNTG